VGRGLWKAHGRRYKWARLAATRRWLKRWWSTPAYEGCRRTLVTQFDHLAGVLGVDCFLKLHRRAMASLHCGLFVRAAANCCLFALVAARRDKDDDVDK
jgi:hypothetical protein